MVGLVLNHGSYKLSETPKDWGSDGPVFGPLVSVRDTYGQSLSLANGSQLPLVWSDVVDGRMAYYDHVFYGCWTVCPFEQIQADPYLSSRLEPFVSAKALFEPEGCGSADAI